MQVYLDNAATTPLDPAVLEAMLPFLSHQYGNPSSIHSHGRQVRVAVEKARKTIAGLLNTSPSEIFFTSGGTEADNTVIFSTIRDQGIKRVISSVVEHHAVLHTLEYLAHRGEIRLDLVALDHEGGVNISHLEELLEEDIPTLVSLMHANNEIGNLIDLDAIGHLCKAKNALFHSDTVQTMGHYRHDLAALPIDYLVGAAHKFHGPKGAGFLYMKAESKIKPFIYGGSQERNQRGGTENVAGIIGLAKALEIAYQDMDEHHNHIQGLKTYMINKLKESFSEDVAFNGKCPDADRSLYTVLNVSLPENEDNDMLLFNLDIAGISASGGSACSSGSEIGSHVLRAVRANGKRGNVRFSFSKYNTTAEIDFTIHKLTDIFAAHSVKA
jgi:cysteine desulfurase